MPVNWFLESVKWKFLLKDIEQVTFIKSFQAIMIGITSGIATPNRIGEYLGRTVVLEKRHRVKGSLATILGSWSQVLITLSVGFVAWSILFNDIHFFKQLHYRPLFYAALFLFILILLLIFFNLQWVKQLAKWFNVNQKYIDEIRFLNKFKARELSYVLFLSFFRYVVFALQYVIILRWLGVDVPLLNSLAAIGLIYLIILFIPHFAIAELGVRGSVAVLIFQVYTNDVQSVAIAAGVLWIINLGLPTLIGSYMLLFSPPKVKKVEDQGSTFTF
jgi:MFS family permease